MDFNLPHELTEFLKNLDRFIDQEIKPLQANVTGVATGNPPGNGSTAGTQGTQGSVNAQARRFLMSVMKDEAAPLALRVEAAIALLPCPEAD